MQQKDRFAKRFLIFVLIYAILVSLLFWIVKDDWRKTQVISDSVNQDAFLPDLGGDMEISQDFILDVDRLHSITLAANRAGGSSDQGKIFLTLSSEGKELASREMAYADVATDGSLTIPLDGVPFPPKGSILTLALRAEGGISFWSGYSQTAGKFQVNVETAGLRVNGAPVEGQLVMTWRGEVDLPYMRYYWMMAAILFAAIVAVSVYCHFCTLRHKKNKINDGLRLIRQYKYLLKTLVVRDFKIKYKASVLGVLWSFLNPLLMTFVYMFVFSTLFRSSIENFVVYLMSGIILYNFFSESTNLGMQSIVGNAGLITKVYMPKYILPISKVISASINLIISLIPLMIMMALTGVQFGKSLLLIPVVLFFLILFCVGVSLILSAVMVYCFGSRTHCNLELSHFIGVSSFLPSLSQGLRLCNAMVDFSAPVCYTGEKPQ